MTTDDFQPGIYAQEKNRLSSQRGAARFQAKKRTTERTCTVCGHRFIAEEARYSCPNYLNHPVIVAARMQR